MSLPLPSGTAAPSTALLVLLVVGHVLADFLVQRREDVEAKRRGAGYGTHGVAVFLTHLAVLLPLVSVEITVGLAVIAALHVGIDWGKHQLTAHRRGEWKPFVVDQVFHLAVLVLGWVVLIGMDAVPDFRWLPVQAGATYLGIAILTAGFAFNATGGSVIVEAVLGNLSPNGEEEGEVAAGHEGAGRLIGILERTLVLALVLYGQWAAIMLLIAAKSIARFEELKVRRFAEYYLVGTLTSLLVALANGVALLEVLLPLLE